MKKSSTDGTSTIYIGSIYEKHQDGSWIDYYNAFGRRIAMRKHSGPSDTTGTIYFLLADTLGSTSTVLSATGTVVESEKYYPYGSLRSGGLTTTDKQFTGQQNEGTPFGLYDYGARFYSTVTGQFISADPKVQSTYDPLCWDRYAYAQDNPLRYVDPTGLDASDLRRLAEDLGRRGISGGDFERAMSAREGGSAGSTSGQQSSDSEMQAASDVPCGTPGCRPWTPAEAFYRMLEQDPGALMRLHAVAAALSQIGKTYSESYDNGQGPNFWDCSGLVQYAWGQAGVWIPRNAQEQFDYLTGQLHSRVFNDPGQLRPGDLVFYYEKDEYGHIDKSVIGHVAMYAGNGWSVVSDGKRYDKVVAVVESDYENLPERSGTLVGYVHMVF